MTTGTTMTTAPTALWRMALALLCTLLLGSAFTAWAIFRADHLEREALLQQTYLVAQSISPETVRTLDGNLSDNDKPTYHRLKTQLMAAVQIDPDWEWIYLMDKNPEGQILFQVDSEAYDAPDPSPPGQIYGEATDILHGVFVRRLAATEGPVPDRWGTWVSAFVPLEDPRSGELLSVLGIDIEAGRWRATILRAGLWPAVFTLALMGILIAGFMVRRPNSSDSQTGRWRHKEAILSLATGVVLTAAGVWLAAAIESTHLTEAFHSLAGMRTAHVLEAFRNLQDSDIEGLSMFFESSENVSLDEFHRYASHLGQTPEVRAWGWIPHLPGAGREAFEQAMRTSHSPDFQIWEKGPDGQRIPAAPRNQYLPIQFLEPIPDQPDIDLGFDGMSVESIRAALEESARTRLATSVDLTALDAEPASSSILIARAAFHPSPQGKLLGYVVAVVDPALLLRAAIRAHLDGHPFIDLDLIRLRSNEAPAPIASIRTGTPIHPRLRQDQLLRPILAFGETFAVATRPTAEFRKAHARHLGWILLFAGLAVSLATTLVIHDVSHRREDLARLVDSRTRDLATSILRYNQLAHHNRTITWEVDENGLFTSVSDVAAAVCGFSPQDLVRKKHFYDLHPEENREEFQRHVLDTFRQRQPGLDLIHPVVTRSGETLWMSTNGLPILNAQQQFLGYQGTSTDITARMRAEDALRDSERKFRMLTESMKDVVWTLDIETFRFLYVSPAAEKLLGMPRDAILSRSIFETLLPARRNDLERLLRQRTDQLRRGELSTDQFFINQIDHLHANGSVIHTEVITRYWKDDRTGRLELQGVSRDITERIRAEHIREMSVQTLQILNQPDDLNTLINRLAGMFKDHTGLDAVGIRLQTGHDEPCVAQHGFSCHHMQQHDLLARDAQGRVFPSAQGRLTLPCACGLALPGNTDPQDPLFTSGGSCWTNDASTLPPPPATAPAGYPCLESGFASIALVPILARGEIVGLLQFNDRRPNQFSREIIQTLEDIAAHIGDAILRKRAEHDYRILFHEMLEGFSVHEIICDPQGRPVDYRFLAINPAFERMTGLKAADVLGKTVLEVLPQTEPSWIETYGQVALTGSPTFFQQYSAALDKHFEVAAFRPAPHQFACIFSDITERVKAEAELRESRRQYASLMANLPGMAYRCQNDRNWTMDFVSEGSRELTGYSPEDLVGNQALSFNNLICPHHRERVWQKWQDVLQVRGRFEDEYEITTRDGQVKWVWEQGEGVFGEDGRILALEGFISDIDERKRAGLERERLVAAIEQSGETVVITDAAGSILYVNAAFEKITGYSRAEAIGQNPKILSSGQHDREFYRQMWNTLMAGQPWEGQIVNRRKDGSLYTEMAAISPVRDPSGRIVHFVAVKRDITQQLHNLEEKEHLQSQLLQAQKMESIGRLAGGIAHDFNNMLQSILGYTEMALDQVPPDQPLHSDLVEIQKAAQRSSALTRQLQAFARKQNVAPRLIDLNSAIDGMTSMLRPLIPEGIALGWKPGPDLGQIKIDPSQLDRLVTNLCINARDAIGPSGHIDIETQRTSVDRLRHNLHGDIEPGEYIVLSIRDDGCGMAPDVIQHIFEPFFTTKGSGKGTGLGLATVYGIVQQSGGILQVDSQPGNGTTFRIFFPRQTGATTDLPPSEETPSLATRGTETILIVEDEETLLQTASRMLTSMGYQVLATLSPQEALKIVDDCNGAIDLVLSDVIMPGLTGPAMVQTMLERHPNIKCLFMSGYTANLIAQEGIRADSVNYLPKPFSRNTLAQKVRDVLDRKT